MAEAPATVIRVALLDDHEVVRSGVANLVNAQPDMEVVGEAGTVRDIVAVVASATPDVAVLDVRLDEDEGNGIAACREIRSEHPNTACLILTSFADDQALVDASLAGAAGFVLKQIRGNDLVESIRKVAAGAQLLDSAETRMAMQRLRQTDAGALEQLTDQERRVFDLIGEGFSNKEIGAALSIAEKTVKNYVSQVLAKLFLIHTSPVRVLKIDRRVRSLLCERADKTRNMIFRSQLADHAASYMRASV
ncbi:MAG: response regulator transcription factor [Actinomycetota bacterium]